MGPYLEKAYEGDCIENSGRLAAKNHWKERTLKKQRGEKGIRIQRVIGKGKEKLVSRSKKIMEAEPREEMAETGMSIVIEDTIDMVLQDMSMGRMNMKKMKNLNIGDMEDTGITGIVEDTRETRLMNQRAGHIWAAG